MASIFFRFVGPGGPDIVNWVDAGLESLRRRFG
jgi:hypothetical protein